nr:reverse transcriptase domain-containing protein [Tanacetum cinerariifolium]
MKKFFQIFQDLHFDISFVDALLLMPKFASTIKSLLTNKDKLFDLAKVPLNENCSDGELTPTWMTLELVDSQSKSSSNLKEIILENQSCFNRCIWGVNYPKDVIDIACKEFVQDVLDFQYNPKSSNPTLVSDASISESDFSKEPIVKSSLPTLIPFRESDFVLEEIKDFLNDDSIPTLIKNYVYDPERDILFLEKLLNEDPFQLPLMDLKLAEESKAKSFVKEPPELELKELPSHLEYAFIEDSNKFPVIIANDLKDVEKEALINVLKSHKWPIAWKISNIKGIDPRFCTHKILMEDDYKPVIHSQRRPVGEHNSLHSQKGGMTVVANENNKLIPTRLVTGWRVCIDYRKLNDVTRKDHFLLPFLDQMLKRLAENKFYSFLDGFQGHKILKSGIEVDRAKVDVIAKLYYPTTFKGVRSFLGHASFYRRFIQDFAKIARPMTHLLEKKTPFVYSKESFEILKACHEGPTGGHHGSNLTVKKVFDAVFFWPSIYHDAHELIKTCNTCIDFMGLFSSSKGNKYILEAVDYLSKWVKAKALPTIDARVIVKFLKSLFSRVMIKYGVTHRLATTYNPQMSVQVEVSNHGLKRILERTTVGGHRKLQLNKLSELHDQAYENSMIYKERTNKLHDSKMKNHIFNVGDQVLLFNSRLKIFSGKLKTRWSSPFTITKVFPYGTIELSQPNGLNFKVNGHHAKHYFGGDIPTNVALDFHTFPMDN